MNIEEMKSNLQMKNLYFSRCTFERSDSLDKGEIEMTLAKRINKTGEHEYDVALKLNAGKADMQLEIVANAVFVYEADSYEDEQEIIEHNTVAIMFPYVRSQATLMTSQPGMQPIIVPPINTTNFM